jgi:muconolactone delta-isomerase
MSENPLPVVPTTKILAIGRPTASGTSEAIARLRASEVRATIALHLSGLIEQWWFQIDGRAPIFLINVTEKQAAHDILEALPLGKAGFMEFDLVRLGPLRPLAVLLD